MEMHAYAGMGNCKIKTNDLKIFTPQSHLTDVKDFWLKVFSPVHGEIIMKKVLVVTFEF